MIHVSWLPGTLFPVVTGLQKGGEAANGASRDVDKCGTFTSECMLERTSNAAMGLGDRIQFKSKSCSKHHMHSCATEPSTLCEYSLSSPSCLRGISLESCTLMLRSDSVQLMLPVTNLNAAMLETQFDCCIY